MEGAAAVGNVVERAYMALDAGCDRILVCNNRAEAIKVIEAVEKKTYSVKDWQVPYSYPHIYAQLEKNPEWQHAVRQAAQFFE